MKFNLAKGLYYAEFKIYMMKHIELRSKFYKEPIFLTYPSWTDPQHRHVEGCYLPQIDIFPHSNRIFPPHIAIQ